MLDGLGAYFPYAPNFAWLDDDGDVTVGTAFTSEDGGWLGSAEDTEFWQIVSDVDDERPHTRWVTTSTTTAGRRSGHFSRSCVSRR
nr:hypothetical protein [Kibdelosporangium sp. MJ126-NF4]CEL12801.1 hypothetical protein [Kibdelosporangium sp. MJ126-NF4]CTQ98487.1 hypothetical protein [Kibdelosporangium sp. MJ126-NF4]